MSNSRRRFQMGGMVVVCIGLFAGCCKKNDEVVTYRVEKPEKMVPVAPTSGQREMPAPMSSMPALPSAPRAADQPVKYAWDVPTEWKTLPATGMRLASFSFEASNKTVSDISVIVLTGEAGGLTANINRWRGQIGLESQSEADVMAGITTLATAAGTVQACAFSSSETKQGISAGILVDDQESWFFKVSGPDVAVTECQESFTRFLQSLRKSS